VFLIFFPKYHSEMNTILCSLHVWSYNEYK